MSDREPLSSRAADSVDAFEARLTRTLGAVVGGLALSRALGFPSQDAFRQAFSRGRLPIRVFELEGRRGRFALTSDIARWLWARRLPSEVSLAAEDASQLDSR